MGLVIFTGLGLGTMFTLFVVPAVYVLLAKDRNPELHELQDAALETPAI
jgi:multidrug efflux pump